MKKFEIKKEFNEVTSDEVTKKLSQFGRVLITDPRLDSIEESKELKRKQENFNKWSRGESL